MDSPSGSQKLYSPTRFAILLGLCDVSSRKYTLLPRKSNSSTSGVHCFWKLAPPSIAFLSRGFMQFPMIADARYWGDELFEQRFASNIRGTTSLCGYSGLPLLYPRLEVVVETNLLVVLRTPPGLLQTGFAHEPDVVGRIGSNHSIVIIARGTCGNRVSCTGCIFRVVPSKVRGQDRHWDLAGCVLIKTGAAPRCRMSATPVR